MSMKRKAAAGGLASASPAAKRSRRTGDTLEEVTRKGLEILEALRDSKDKHGRSVAARFEKLPDKKKETAWYEQVTLPLSLQMIETKLQQGNYPSMTALESDLLRLVINWKDVYDRSSESHKEAEKVRKIVTVYMKDKLLNPQYQLDPNHVPIPTPAPEPKEEDNEEVTGSGMQVDSDAKGDRPRGRIILRRSTQTAAVPSSPPQPPLEPEESNKPPRLRLRAPRRSDGPASDNAGNEEVTETPPPVKRGRLILRRSSVSTAEPQSVPVAEPASEPKPKPEYKPEPAPEPKKPRPTGSSLRMPAAGNEGFQGKTMSQAQDKILNELFELEDHDGNSISAPFVNLPSRELKDYYAAVKQPLSLKGAQKLVRGVKGRDKPTGITLLETWQEYEDEVSRIWNNARIYNEDESDICKLAGQLEKYFKLRLEEAKKSVADPVKPKLKLHVSKTSEPPSSAEADAGHAAPSGPIEQPARFTVDEEALKRQRQLVANGIVGTSAHAIMPATSSSFSFTNGSVYPEASKLPPSVTPRLQPALTRPLPSPASEDTKRPWDAWNRSDRPESYRWPYTTIKEILLISHPSLDLGEKAYRWALYPWKEFNYSSDTIPMRTETTRILLSPLLVKPTRDKPVVYHHVTLNGVRLQASSSAPRISGGQASEEDNLYRPVYDVQLNADDVNELMVECYSCPAEVCDTKDVLFDKHMINIQPR